MICSLATHSLPLAHSLSLSLFSHSCSLTHLFPTTNPTNHQGGKIPIVVDTSPCLSQIKAGISEPGLRFALYEPVEFIRHFLVDKLEFAKVCMKMGVVFVCVGV